MGRAPTRTRDPPLDRDVALLFATRCLRMVAYGSLATVLVLYLVAIGLGGSDIGLVLAQTLRFRDFGWDKD